MVRRRRWDPSGAACIFKTSFCSVWISHEVLETRFLFVPAAHVRFAYLPRARVVRVRVHIHTHVYSVICVCRRVLVCVCVCVCCPYCDSRAVGGKKLDQLKFTFYSGDRCLRFSYTNACVCVGARDIIKRFQTKTFSNFHVNVCGISK